MYVIEVIPLRRGMHRAALSYFSKTPYERGTLLDIPLRKQSAQGVVISSQEVSLAKAALRGASFLLRKLPPQTQTQKFPSALLRTADELSEYYAAQPGAVLFALLPNEIKNGEKRILGASQEVVETFDQREKVSYNLNSSCKERSGHTHEILQAPFDTRILAYQSIVRTSFAEGKSVLIVVPTVEDGEFIHSLLSPGIPQRAYVLHRSLGVRRLALAYGKLRESNRAVLIIATPQHALLARDDIGTVVLEHSRSFAYRGHSRPYVDFRYALLVHARHRGQTLITADTLIRTEDEFLVRENRAFPFEENHPKRLALPGTLKTITMKDKTDGQTPFALFSPLLLEAIEKTRLRRGRAFLFCARRGLASIVACIDCGTILRCPRSGSPLALHRFIRDDVEERWLVSSVSGYRRKADDLCPECGSWRLRPQGIGVQHVYDELVKHLGSDDIFLFDYQTASTHKKAKAIYEGFYAKKRTVLLGTALALPYMHEPVETSAVVSLEALRAIPSWRQQEEALGILLALREKTLGYVFVQTRGESSDDLLRHTQDGTTSAYYTEELAAREKFQYPPYSTFIHLTWKKTGDDALTTEITERLAPFDIAIYSAPTVDDGLTYGLIRAESRGWPQDALVDALRSLPPQVRIIINPDRVV